MTQLSRRSLLKGATGLVIGMQLPLHKAMAAGSGEFMPNAFVEIKPDSTVNVIIKHLEMGQGPMTGLATLVAEELDADWAQIKAELAPANTALYKNLGFGMQATGGSTSIANSYLQMRQAGAAAKMLLVQAASETWEVPASELRVEKGVISHPPSGKNGQFGDFVQRAAKLSMPEVSTLALKDLADFQLIGKGRAEVGRLDSQAKSTGKANFTIDVQEPGTLVAVVAHPPLFGATVKQVDAAEALKVRGVKAVKTIPTGVAVYADATWPAIKARKLLKIDWDTSAAETRGTEEMFADYAELAKKPGAKVNSHGNIEKGLAGADVVIEKTFHLPFLAHSPMEPLDGFIRWDDNSATVRMGCQMQTGDQAVVASILGLPTEQVTIKTELAGGSFGRRATMKSDFAAELAQVVKALGKKQPVKLIWTREDDVQGGFYRPMFLHTLRAGIKQGQITAWQNRVVGSSFLAGMPDVKNGIDESMVEGLSNLPYSIPNFFIDMHIAENGVPTSFWRSVGHSHTGYVKECMIDELLEKTEQDPVEGRLALMGSEPRLAGALKAVAKLADWGRYKPAKGRALGVAAAESFHSYVAQIAEVSMADNGEPKVHKVWCAVDCGVAVNPDVVKAQMEGGIGFGLGHVLYGEITLKGGKVQQSNFHNYRSLRINEMPQVEVVIVPSAEAPTGVGEPGVPPIGAAIANAMARLGRARPTTLPMVNA